MESDSFKILRGFSTGVIIGVAFLHLLPDSVSIPIILHPSEYDCKILYSFILFDIIFSYFLIVTYPLIVLGIVLLLGFEQFAIFMMTVVDVPQHQSVKKIPVTKHNENNIEMQILSTIDNNQYELEHQGHQEHVHEHIHSMGLIADLDTTKSFIKSLIMEISIAVHSVIIGFEFGTLGKSETTTIQALLIAFVFHQFFEGVSLGSTISQTKLSNKTCIVQALVYSLH